MSRQLYSSSGEEDEGGGRPPRKGHNRFPKFGHFVGGKMSLLLFTLLALNSGLVSAWDVEFEDPSQGFFLRESTSTTPALSGNVDSTDKNVDEKVKSKPNMSNVDNKEKALSTTRSGDILHSANFAVLKSSQPITIRAQYGPFQARQTVPTQFPVPDLPSDDIEVETLKQVSGHPYTDYQPRQLDLSAHIVTKAISKDNPVLRVLFHTGQRAGVGQIRPDPIFHSSQATICASLTVILDRQPTSKLNISVDSQKILSNVCSPDGRDGTCLSQVTLPALWWPSMTHSVNSDVTKTTPMKTPKVNVKVSYSVFETKAKSCVVEKASRVSIVPETVVGNVPLVFPSRGYRQLAKDEILHMLLPQSPVYPNSKIYVPVFLEQPRTTERGPISALTIKCRARGGFRLENVEATSRLWTVRAEMNARGTVATVNVFKKNLETTQGTKDKTEELPMTSEEEDGPQELFNWLLALDDRDYDSWDKGRISWHVRYHRPAARTLRPVESVNNGDDKMLADQPVVDDNNVKTFDDDDVDVNADGDNYFDKDRYRLGARLSIQKDYVEAVIPIAKNTEIMNLAALTGRQISQPLKVFIVSQAGEVADVTLNSLCTSKDQSVLKVSSSCTSVYVDGSETRGALSAVIDAKYGQQVGRVEFTIWMPETPLTVDVEDNRLSLIKGWRIPALSANDVDWQRRKSSNESSSNKTDNGSISGSCGLRFQQTRVSVFAKFLAEDPDSGRREFFPARGFELDVTDLLVGHGLRVADAKVASLRGNILQGLAPGRTEVQVVSPITGQEIGIREIKVAKNKETIREMRVRVLSGLSVKIQPEQVGQQRGRYSVQTSYSQVLTSKYQEGLLDIEVVLSDDTKIPLREVSPAEYYLAVKSLEPRVIAFAPSQEARYPRVIAVSSGQGKLLRISLELVDSCLDKSYSDVPLAVAEANVNVKIQNQKSVDNNLWDTSKNVDSPATNLDTQPLSNIALQDDQSYYGKPVVSNGRYETRNAESSQERYATGRVLPHTLSPLEVGMYILLSVFVAAIAIFMASCFVYASKFRRYNNNNNCHNEFPLTAKSQSVQNANDWVWLGKSNGSKLGSEVEMNITTNPRADDIEDNLSSSQQQQLQQQPLMTSTTNTAASTRSRQRTLAKGHLPPPGHPAHGAPPFQIPEEMAGLGSQGAVPGPYQQSHRYHQQQLLLPARPQRYLPAPPINQRLSPIYQNSNNILNRTFDRSELEMLQQQQQLQQQLLQQQQQQQMLQQQQQLRMIELAKAEQRRLQKFQSPTVIIPNPVEDLVFRSESEAIKSEAKRIPVDTSTYTKKPPMIGGRNEATVGGHDRGGLILPVGYPYYPSDQEFAAGCSTADSSPEVSRRRGQPEPEMVEDYFEEQFHQRCRSPDQQQQQQLSPLELLPDPSELEMDPDVPIRQSPASALPPMVIGGEDVMIDDEVYSDRGEYFPLNPDIDRPSPPRAGSSRLFENPFELTDEESMPLAPEKLSPSHLFESSTLEEELLQEQQQKVSPLFDSRTFVIKKSPSPTASYKDFIVDEKKKSPISETVSLRSECESEALGEAKAEAEDDDASGMDYDSLMAYFENLKESTA